MSKQRYLVTGALPYSNGRLHVGHIAGAYLPADIYVRYLRSCGHEVRFICGSDDNGVAIPITAMREGSTPQEVSSRYNRRQQLDFAGLGIEFDIYGGTHQPGFVGLHEKLSQEFFRTVHQHGHFIKKKSKQLYDTQAGKFLPDRYVKGKCPICGYEEAFGDQCEHCGNNTDPLTLIAPLSTITGSRPEVRETTHWHMQLQKFEQQLRDWLSQHNDCRPTVLNFSLGLLRGGLPERAMTRDLDWGVPVPLDDPDAAGKVLYVWFDAPIGYVSFTARYCADHQGGAENYARWWKDPGCKIIHFIGEDNTIFHALIWPAMLMAEGTYQLPSAVVANSFLNIKFPGKEEEKISKSRGTAIWIQDYLQQFDPDPLRYYLTSLALETQRVPFKFEEFIERNNNELIGALGNLLNRWQSIFSKQFDRRVPEAQYADVDKELLARMADLPAQIGRELDGFRFKAALGRLMDAARTCNQYVEQTEPWKTSKTDRQRCATTINVCVQSARTMGTCLTPFMPFTGSKVRAMFGFSEDEWAWAKAAEPVPAGRELAPLPILFKKLEADVLGERS
jgi:methionyl-tRNA synthetase